MANNTTNTDLIEAKVRDTHASAALKEFKLQVQQGKYVLLADVNKRWAEDANKVRTKLQGLSSRVVPQLAGQIHEAAVIKRLIDDIVYEALTELSDTYEVKS